MKWTVQRYVLREVVQTWLAVTGVLVAILVSNQLSRVLGQAAGNDYGRHVVFDLIALGAIMNLSVIVPVGLLLSIVLALGPAVPRQRDGGAASLRFRARAPARALVLLRRGDCRGSGLARRSSRSRAPTSKRSCCANRRSKRRNSDNWTPAASARSSAAAAMRSFTPNASIEEGLLHNVFVRRESAGRIEVALADTATYSKAAPNGMHFVTLFNGRRYEGVPGRSDFRVIEFREHGIPIVDTGRNGRQHAGSGHQAEPRAYRLERALRYRAAAIPGIESHHGAGLDSGGGSLEPPASAAGPLRPRRIRHRRVLRVFEFAVRRQGVGGERRSAAGDRRLVGAYRHLGARLVSRVSRGEKHVNTLDRYLYRTVLLYTLMAMAVLLTLGALFVFISQQSDIGVGNYTASDAFLFTFLNLPQQSFELLPIGAMIGALMGLGQSRGGKRTGGDAGIGRFGVAHCLARGSRGPHARP